MKLVETVFVAVLKMIKKKKERLKTIGTGMMKVFKSLSEVVINLIVHLMVLALCDLKATSTASWSCSLPPPGGNVFSRSLYAWPIQRVGLWPSPTQRQSQNSWQNKFDIWLNMLTTYSSCNLWCDWVKCFTKNILFIYFFKRETMKLLNLQTKILGACTWLHTPATLGLVR